MTSPAWDPGDEWNLDVWARKMAERPLSATEARVFLDCAFKLGEKAGEDGVAIQALVSVKEPAPDALSIIDKMIAEVITDDPIRQMVRGPYLSALDQLRKKLVAAAPPSPPPIIETEDPCPNQRTTCMGIRSRQDQQIRELHQAIARQKKSRTNEARSGDGWTVCKATYNCNYPEGSCPNHSQRVSDAVSQTNARIHNALALLRKMKQLAEASTFAKIYGPMAGAVIDVLGGEGGNLRTQEAQSDAYGLPNDLNAAKEEIHEWRQAIQALGLIGGPDALRKRASEVFAHHDTHHILESKIRAVCQNGAPYPREVRDSVLELLDAHDNEEPRTDNPRPEPTSTEKK